MHELLQLSKSRLLKPSRTAKRRVLIILNVTYIIATCVFLITQKVNTGILVHNVKLFYFGYLPALTLNFLSLIFHLMELFKVEVPRKINGNVLAICSIIPVFFMSFLNQIGYGNPGFDSILFDYPLAIALILVAAMVVNKDAAIIWSVILFGTLFYNVSLRGVNYQYHYLTPNEVVKYETALAQGDANALKRQKELKEADLNPPQITRYTLQWIVFIIITAMAVVIFTGANKKIVNLVSPVINEIEKESLKLARKKAELEKEIAIKTERQKMSDLREQTFINLAHEIRTPLTLINNSLDEYTASHESNNKLELIKLHTSKLTRDIVNFFDLERLEKGFELYNHDTCINFSEMLNGYLTLFMSSVRKKELQLESNIEDDLFVKADAMALSSIIKNLLENALKYTNTKDRILVSLTASDGHVIFKVRDTGMGIPKEDQKLIFQPYYQIKNKKRSNDGMGLGLPIVENIVSQLEGEITLKSVLHEYTSFSVKLPKVITESSIGLSSKYDLETTSYLNFNEIEVKDAISSSYTKHILVVEDNIEMLKHIVIKLGLKFNVYAAKNVKEAFQKLEAMQKVDLIISDIMMDEIDGIQFRRELINNPEYKNISFIFLSAKTHKKSKEEGLALGAIDYVSKPFNMTELSIKVESILNNQERQLKTFGDSLIKQAMSRLNEKYNGNSCQLKNKESFEDTCKSVGLTPKEIEVSQFITKGFSYKEIANRLHRSERTIQTHAKKIFEKAGVNNKVELLNKLGLSEG
ncbi:ATP-binding response regulator [Chondrinema litorale]|uniref:ATP-binding response regulator n=1 Tax=Chondrinema litorale TaxID=2994555 RepID=UPI002542AC0D|nr:ATP-binding protein [Chondrinema litorale]UZR99002.1 ATP-binding protein [Chondrinema litorale]